MAGMPIPTVEEVDGGIRVTILRKLDGSVTPQATDQASDQPTDQPTDQATDQARMLLNLVRQRRMSLKEMMDELNLSHRPSFKKSYLFPCLEAGWMDRVYPDKPSHPDQRYFLTDLGKKQLSRCVQKGLHIPIGNVIGIRMKMPQFLQLSKILRTFGIISSLKGTGFLRSFGVLLLWLSFNGRSYLDVGLITICNTLQVLL